MKKRKKPSIKDIQNSFNKNETKEKEAVNVLNYSNVNSENYKEVEYFRMAYIELVKKKEDEHTTLLYVDVPESIVGKTIITNGCQPIGLGKNVFDGKFDDQFYGLDAIIVKNEDRQKTIELISAGIKICKNLGFKDYDTAKINIFKKFTENLINNHKDIGILV